MCISVSGMSQVSSCLIHVYICTDLIWSVLYISRIRYRSRHSSHPMISHFGCTFRIEVESKHGIDAKIAMSKSPTLTATNDALWELYFAIPVDALRHSQGLLGHCCMYIMSEYNCYCIQAGVCTNALSTRNARTTNSTILPRVLELARSANSSMCDMCLELIELLALAILEACSFPDVDSSLSIRLYRSSTCTCGLSSNFM